MHLPPGNSKEIEWGDPDRFFAGLGLYNSGKADKIIFTGGVNPLASDLPPEGNIYIKKAISFGIPAKDLFTTYPVLNTYEEAKAVREILDTNSLNQNKIILVTSAFHMKRAKKVFEREGIKVISFPVDFKGKKNFISNFKNISNYIPSSKSLNMSSLAIREIIGRIIYTSY